MILHTFSDNSILTKISVQKLIGIPVWRGNRYIDINHAIQIKKDIGDAITKLDTTIFRIIKYKDNSIEQHYLIDGQHRQYVLKKYFEENLCANTFDVLVIEKEVEEESDAIEYFNTLNNVKPQFETDPKILANKYIIALEKWFNKDKKNILIRPEGKTTRRPFLSSDKLRLVLEDNSILLKQSKEYIQRFIEKVDTWNKNKVCELEIHHALHNTNNKFIIDASLEKRFVLAFDPKLPWVSECLGALVSL